MKIINIAVITIAVIASLSPLACLAEEGIGIKVIHPDGAPYFVGVPDLNIYSSDFSTIKIRIRSDKSGLARLFWATSYDPQVNEPKSIWFFLDRSMDYKEYVFDVSSQNRSWAGFIKQLVIYPDNGIQGIEIDSIRAVQRSPVSFLRSGWREFWGPSGRLIIGASVNNMKAITLWGRSVNIYIYLIILLSAACAFGYFYFKSNDPGLSWKNAASATILATMVLWGVLACVFLVSESYQLRSDLAKYDLKPLNEKQEEMVGKDFYDFLMFCKSSIPEKNTVFMLSAGPNKEYYILRAIYYLYPLNFYSLNKPSGSDIHKPAPSVEAEYIISYEYDKSIGSILLEYPRYRLFKEYNERAYILWKKK